MEKIQLCFRISEDKQEVIKEKITLIKSQLDAELGQGNYIIVSCHLNKKIVEEKGFDPTMIDFLHDTFGKSYVNLCEATTFTCAMKDMNTYRTYAASISDRLYIVDENIGNISLELQLFTNNKVRTF